MRKVYAIFALRVLKHPITLQVALFWLALMTFAQMVHVKSIVDTLLRMPVGKAPGYVLQAFMHGEVLTLIAIGTMVFVVLSFPLQIRRIMMPKVARHVAI